HRAKFQQKNNDRLAQKPPHKKQINCANAGSKPTISTTDFKAKQTD
ncbi:hypothetical protein D048_4617B, partial [Vibrio parahaemolyticus VPTS-2009]